MISTESLYFQQRLSFLRRFSTTDVGQIILLEVN